MSGFDEIRTAIECLSKKELARFRRWFIKYDDEIWDSKIESDVNNRKFDVMGRKALREHRAGRTKALS